MRKLGLSFWVWVNPLNIIPFSSIYLPEILDFFFFTIAICLKLCPLPGPMEGTDPDVITCDAQPEHVDLCEPCRRDVGGSMSWGAASLYHMTLA